MTTPPEVPAVNAAFRIEDLPIATRPEEAPLLYLDGFQGFSVFNDTVRINAYQISQNLNSTEASPYRIFTARIAMSPGTALQLVKWLSDNLKNAGVTEIEVPVVGNAP